MCCCRSSGFWADNHQTASRKLSEKTMLLVPFAFRTKKKGKFTSPVYNNEISYKLANLSQSRLAVIARIAVIAAAFFLTLVGLSPFWHHPKVRNSRGCRVFSLRKTIHFYCKLFNRPTSEFGIIMTNRTKCAVFSSFD